MRPLTLLKYSTVGLKPPQSKYAGDIAACAYPGAPRRRPQEFHAKPRHVPSRPQDAPRRPDTPQVAPKMPPRRPETPQVAPKTPRDAPAHPQDAPQDAPVVSKTVLRSFKAPFQNAPKTLPKTRFNFDSCRVSIFGPPWEPTSVEKTRKTIDLQFQKNVGP